MQQGSWWKSLATSIKGNITSSNTNNMWSWHLNIILIENPRLCRTCYWVCRDGVFDSKYGMAQDKGSLRIYLGMVFFWVILFLFWVHVVWVGSSLVTSERWTPRGAKNSPKPSGSIELFNFSSWNAKCPIFLGNFTPKTSKYCLKNRALGFPGCFFSKFVCLKFGKRAVVQPCASDEKHTQFGTVHGLVLLSLIFQFPIYLEPGV